MLALTSPEAGSDAGAIPDSGGFVWGGQGEQVLVFVSHGINAILL